MQQNFSTGYLLSQKRMELMPNGLLLLAVALNRLLLKIGNCQSLAQVLSALVSWIVFLFLWSFI